jgi:hypothetical protein
MPPKDSNEYKELWEAINKMVASQTKIETLLIGEEGSGLYGQVRELKEKKADKEALNTHLENHKNSKGELKWIITTALTVIVFVVSKFIK